MIAATNQQEGSKKEMKKMSYETEETNDGVLIIVCNETGSISYFGSTPKGKEARREYWRTLAGAL